ncbi:DUF6545 domain-containing protein [Micromonospora sp. C51]|uniref:DUF6545 domain-containing protein n=1 Tax=Micromonospora sp. C51 TaxID=2824879 RepID=UPI001B372844|nr:DUF6545 domain-containing protein [Micromonospora sp. C51]
MDDWCETIGRARGRTLRVHDLHLGVDLPPGLLVRRHDQDTIVVDAALPALTRTQTILHEVAHIVLDHDGDARHDDIDPAVEAEAELAADVLYQWLTSAERNARAAVHRQAAPALSRIGLTWWADRRADWHLLELWMTLRGAVADVAIISTSTAAPVAVEIRSRRHRHRTVIEVHEALRVLQPWFSPRVHDSATRRARRHRLHPDAVMAVADAATVAVALRHRRTSQPSAASDTRLLNAQHGEYDVPSEARRLACMARALHDSPLVMAEIARWVPTHTPANTAVPACSGQPERPSGSLLRSSTGGGGCAASAV